MDSRRASPTSPTKSSSSSEKQCQLCNHECEKNSEKHHSCILCTKLTCDACSMTQESSSYRYCSKCYKFLTYLPSPAVHQLQLEAMTNHELSTKVSKLQEEINGNVKRLKKLNDDLDSIEEKQTIIDTLQIEVDQNVLKIKEITIGIKTLNLENDEMDKIILDKEEVIESLSQELCRVKAESAENKRNSNTIPPECLELYQENQELKAKLKEMETEHVNYTQQLVDCLEILKVQLVKERSEGNELRPTSESSNDLDSSESIEIEKNRIKQLQEELRIARRQLELMRSSRVDDPVVRSRRGDSNDKKKCEVF